MLRGGVSDVEEGVSDADGDSDLEEDVSGAEERVFDVDKDASDVEDDSDVPMRALLARMRVLLTRRTGEDASES